MMPGRCQIHFDGEIRNEDDAVARDFHGVEGVGKGADVLLAPEVADFVFAGEMWRSDHLSVTWATA